jgi:hypothetical protein
MRRRALLAVIGFATLLLSVGSVDAAPPTFIQFEFDETFPNGFLTAFCGVPVFIHLVGAGTTTLHYDRSGALIREFDTLAPGLTTTIFSPLGAGGTGKSFTDVTRAVSTFLYPEGTEIGDPAIVIFNGVQRTSGPGNPRIVGREVYEGVVIDFTPDGVPIVDPVTLISQSGRFDLAAVLEARCAALTDP